MYYGYGYGLNYKSSGVAVDADAQAFIDAASITDPTQQSAVNQLVLDLKAASIWTKMKAVYPMVGGSASTHKWNLKDPRDLDAAFRLGFLGGWTHSSNGALPNGTTAYADTFISPATSLTSANHFSFYNNGSIANAETSIDVGCGTVGLGELYFWTYREDNTIKYDNGTAAANRISVATTSKGFSVGTRTASTNQKVYKDGVNIGTSTNLNSSSLPSSNIFIGAGNVSGVTNYYSTKRTAFASIGDGLTDQNVTDLYTAVQAFQTTLSRNV